MSLSAAMIDNAPILIVGGGPSGLIMAAALYHHGIGCDVIEKRAAPTSTSNAAVIHARTLEMLDDLNLVDPFLKQGNRIHAINFQHGRHRIARIATNQIESHYNFILSLPQSVSENILNYHLAKIGHPIQRNYVLDAIEIDNSGIIVDIVNPRQQIERRSYQYLIACDGAHSTVRSLLNSNFSGTDIQQQFVIADVHISSNYPDDEIYVYFNEDGPFAVFPFSKNQARVVATITDSQRDAKQPVSLLKIQAIAEKRSRGLIKIHSSNWMSSFQIHQKMLSHLRQGNVFFVGDAAHLHSPVGGQGMNTGMQDAYNLAWKLALTLRGNTKPYLLDSYDQERAPNAAALLTNTERMTSIILARNRLLQWLRKSALRLFMKQKKIQRTIAMELSMLNLHYKHSPIINDEYHVTAKGPLAGHRAPDVDNLLRTTKHSLLIFTGKQISDRDKKHIMILNQWATANQNKNTLQLKIVVHAAVAEQCRDLTMTILDCHNDLHLAYHVHKPCFFMIRPDNYIGCCSAQLDLKLVQHYWSGIFLANDQ